MLWHSLPPEMNTALLMAGAGVEPMLQAAAGWEGLAAALDAQAVELGALLASLQEAWTGASSERAAAAIAPMVTWLQEAAQTAQQRGLQAAAQAASYAKALGMTPSLPEIAVNHISHAVLSATNFLGINLVPIGLNETDYFVRMWNQAGAAMDTYQAETMANTTFEALAPMKPILAAGAGELAESGVVARVRGSARQASAADGEDQTDPNPDDGTPDADHLTERLAQIALISAPVQQMMQQMTQPLQQLASLAHHAGGVSGAAAGGPLSRGPGGLGGAAGAHAGLVGAAAFSRHPLAGGTGRSVGKGLMFAQALPGSGGSAARTPMMAGLLDRTGQGVAPAAAGSGESVMGGAAPVGAMGAAGAGAPAGAAARSGMVAPPALASPDENIVHDEFGQEDDW